MAEPMEQSPHLGTLGSPSGGTRGDESEHLPAGNHALPQNGARGRQRAQNHRRRAESCDDVNTDKFWQTKGGQREVCPALASGNAAQPHDGHPLGDPRPKGAFSNRVQEEGSLVDSDTGLDARPGKKKHRRGTSKKKRNWKPYNKLSWEEKKALEERETVRASRMREEMFAKGLPVAPYNTTQFLMDEHDREEPDLNTETGVRRSLGAEDTGSEEELLDEEDDEDEGSGGGSDGIGRPGNAGGEFLQRDFSETYEMYHVESLQNMTKQELVQEYLELEKCMSRLEEENNRLRRAAPDGSQVRIREMELELERLRAENTELLLQNQPNKDRGQVPAK
ncbi:protein HEXIM1 [Austrofundulus limnaeus]|uniref:Protein HEXIM1 n=1 Tax=Austrofundulus limnaeus TaxID=52670 RepID=A0A2I4CDD7_AUSLI|nr:PREDICTED: protein HEXIM1 [Austrofundulus limnaeus]